MAQPAWGGETLDEQAWNFCWLGEALLPGIVEVMVRKGRKVDEQSVKGSDGAYLSDEGYEPSKVTIRLRISTREQWAAYQDVFPTIDPKRAGGLRQPLPILHPEPNQKGISTVYVTNITGDPPTAKSGKLEIIECIEWFPPKPAKTSKSTKSKKASAIPPDVNVSIF